MPPKTLPEKPPTFRCFALFDMVEIRRKPFPRQYVGINRNTQRRKIPKPWAMLPLSCSTNETIIVPMKLMQMLTVHATMSAVADFEKAKENQ